MKDIVIGIPTVGLSAIRIDASLDCIARYTGFPVDVIVSDDGTGNTKDLEDVCAKYGAKFVVNPDPDMAMNINNLFKHSTQEWVFILDDGILVSKHWLDPLVRIANDFPDQTFTTTKGEARIGVVGVNQVVSQHLVIAGMIPTKYTWQEWCIDWMDREASPAYWNILKEFYERYREWHTGDETWEQICEGVNKWHDEHPGNEKRPYIHRFWPFSHSTQIGTGAPFALRRELWDKMCGFPKGWSFYEWYALIQCMYVQNYIPLFVWSTPLVHHQGTAGVQRGTIDRPTTNREIDPYCKELFGKSVVEMSATLFDLMPGSLRKQIYEVIDDHSDQLTPA